MHNKYSVPASQFILFFFKEYIFHPLSALCKIFLVHHDSSEGTAKDKIEPDNESYSFMLHLW